MRRVMMCIVVMVFACTPHSERMTLRAGEVAGMVELYSAEEGQLKTVERVDLSEDEWRQRLSSEEYRILREHGTERAFTGEYYTLKNPGLYRCAACGADLFLSDHKYDSGSGWPSFFKPIHPANVELLSDSSLGMRRVEVVCARCGSHLGHVFPDGPEPTGKRYCVNSASLDFRPED